MKILLLIPFICVVIVSAQDSRDNEGDSPLQVLEFKWQKDHREPPVQSGTATGPARAVINENKYFQRKAREQLAPGAIDPNEQTIDGRSAAIEKAVQDSRTPQPKRADGYTYSSRVKNVYSETAEVVFWEYRFSERANPANVSRRQFICAVKIKPDESKDLVAFILAGPSEVISAKSLENAQDKLFDEMVLIHRIEYSNGAIMQRKDWNFAELKPAVERAVSTPWGPEICRGL